MQRPHLVKSSVDDSMLFDHLESSWSLQQGPTPDSTWLTFKVDFSFRSQLYGHVADLFFNEVVQRMMGAFEKRCQALYGASSLARGQAQQRQAQRVQQQQQRQQAQQVKQQQAQQAGQVAGPKVAAAGAGQQVPSIKSS